jgi:stage V sporulation protein D (sporulation-specific penicillin-binding protein)
MTATTGRRRKRRPRRKLNRQMRGKMMVLFGAILALLCGLIGRLMYIEYTNGSNYEKKVLSMQSYDSQTIPFQRGDIVDSNGTVLATSVAVYNVILDCSVMTDKEEYIEPTINALVTCFPDLDKSELESYATDKADSKYIVLEKKLEYSAIQGFQDKADNDSNIQGVWFEKEYQRTYPFNTLAASVIGFTSSGDVGTTGLENYYDDELNGVDGREYGYLDADSDFEKTVIAAEDGNTIVTSIDANIQSIVEKKIEQFNEKYRNNYYDDAGSVNTAVLIMNPNTGEILAMADYPEFDLNNPRDLSGIYSEDEIADMSDDDQMDILNSLWQNYCVTATYEPGSVQKPFTVACGLETGKITDNMTFNCDGGEQFDSWISCVARSGHGLETVRSTLMDSCNDAIMQMTYKIGKTNFLTYQSEFGFGQKTGIDLPGEANTSTLVYTEENMKAVDLATNAFGQNYNCTMVQVASAFSSLINGGNYYEPHLVTKITDSSGNTLETIEPKLVKQTVSESTSSQVKDYLYSVVTDGTGNTAKVDGYSMGGKTGTAQKLPRGNGKYLVSFIGFAPYDDPELVIYCIVDEPNAKDEAHSYYAQNIVREILEEVLPYMNIYRDEEKTGVNKGLDVTGVDEQYTGNNNGRVKR